MCIPTLKLFTLTIMVLKLELYSLRDFQLTFKHLPINSEINYCVLYFLDVSCNLRSPFFGVHGICVPDIAFSHVGFMRKAVECKESRIGKQPIPVPSNVAITMDGQDLKVKGPLGELALTYPREVILERDDSGALRVKKAVETRRANQMHGLFRYLEFIKLSFIIAPMSFGIKNILTCTLHPTLIYSSLFLVPAMKMI